VVFLFLASGARGGYHGLVFDIPAVAVMERLRTDGARESGEPTQRKRQAATQRAQTALDALIASGEPITFRGLAQTAGVSIGFLYRYSLRARIEQLRADQQRTPAGPREGEIDQPPSQSNVVRALTAQLTNVKRHHRAEIARLEPAVAAAQGENLELRRQLGRTSPAPG